MSQAAAAQAQAEAAAQAQAQAAAAPVGAGARVDELRLDMGKLPGDRLQGVVTILQRHDPNWQPINGTIQLDLSALPLAAFEDLEQYVRSCIAPRPPTQQPRTIFRSPGFDAGVGHRGATPLGVGLGNMASPSNLGIRDGAPPSGSDSDSE